MCFSATASFVASGVVGSIGVATLRHVREPRTLLFASLPMLFAVHQFTEGWVWFGLEGRIDKLAFDHFAFLFMLYAYCILPLLMPTAVALMEPPRLAARRHSRASRHRCAGMFMECFRHHLLPDPLRDRPELRRVS